MPSFAKALRFNPSSAQIIRHDIEKVISILPYSSPMANDIAALVMTPMTNTRTKCFALLRV